MKAIFVLAALLCVTLSLAVPAPYVESEYQYLFTKWMTAYSKNYEVEDFFYRYSVFKDNLNFIHEHNSENRSYTVGVNGFADLTTKEFKARNSLLSVPETHNSHKITPHQEVDVAAPMVDVDWRSRNVVSAVRDQGQCGSCYSFSSMSTVETAYDIKHGSLVSLSEQYVVDCSAAYGNLGCNGGMPSAVFQFLHAKGAATLQSYPYTGVVGSCKAFSKAAVSVSTFVNVAGETGLLTAAAIGSVVVQIEADTQAFQFYASGVFDNAKCDTNIDHGVVVVGYGTQGTSPYWIVRNSWGAGWGEKGYIRMVRGKNMCAIGSGGPLYPVVA